MFDDNGIVWCTYFSSMGQALFQFKHVKALPKFVEFQICWIRCLSYKIRYYHLQIDKVQPGSSK